jgi:hypothetical protein
MNTMHITTNREYKLLLTHRPLHPQAYGQQWQAMVLESPSILKGALSREMRDQPPCVIHAVLG